MLNFEQNKIVLLGISIILAIYAGGFIRKIKLPSLIGFMLLGVLVGPHTAGLISKEFLQELSFFSDIALGFVAILIGSELSLNVIRKQGSSIWFIIFLESFLSFLFVTVIVGVVTQNWVLALLLGGIAPASAPAGTVAVIQEYRARGPLTKALYSIVGFDDGVGIIIFGFASAAAFQIFSGDLSSSLFIYPFIEIAGSIVLGFFIGFIISFLASKMKSDSDLLTLIAGSILIVNGLSDQFHLSLILANLSAGVVIANSRSNKTVEKLQRSISSVMPFLFLLFFMMAGAHLDITAILSIGLIGIAYIISRSTGKLVGAWAGASIGKSETVVRKYAGPGILSQAGVSIGLALIVQQRMPDSVQGKEIAAITLTVITATSLVFEIIGPLFTKWALDKAGEIGSGQ